jgi:16S rRNA A1518/A1519 N6-dimethyltransferase RsmA/KsgA/DIM1 with predicted DNA glycosylase/AP lyase activity
MFVLSKRQLSRLIPQSILSQTPPLLLDIGSGDGHVTDNLRQVLSCTSKSVHVTEASVVMQRVLQKKGFRYDNNYVGYKRNFTN